MFSKRWWKSRLKDVANTVGRAVRTGAQTALGVIGTDAVGVVEVDWLGVLSASVLSMVMYVLMTIAFGESRDRRETGRRRA